MNRVVLAFAVALAAAAYLAVPALAHQSVTSNGATVTMHVEPNDEPEAGSPASIRVLKVAVSSRARFRFSTCGCRIKISDSSGHVLRDKAMQSRTKYTFPKAGAYKLTYSGSYTRSGKRKRFSASFAIRAS
jgi:hypothetical protein